MAGQLLSFALGHLAMRVEAELMTALPGLTVAGKDEQLEGLKRATRTVLPARREAQPETQSPARAASLDGQCQLQAAASPAPPSVGLLWKFVSFAAHSTPVAKIPDLTLKQR